MMLKDDAIYRARSEVRFRTVGEEGVVVRQDTAEVIAVNDVGASLLSLLRTPKSVAEMVEALLAEYDVDRDTLRRDVSKFLEKLEEAGVVETAK
jgi:hypothetical protein